jgi:hypothetical protein
LKNAYCTTTIYNNYTTLFIWGETVPLYVSETYYMGSTSRE